MAAVTDKERELFTVLSSKFLADFMNMNEEVKGKMMADYGRMTAGDQELKARSETDKQECFTAADANSDGLLSKEEFGAYIDA